MPRRAIADCERRGMMKNAARSAILKWNAIKLLRGTVCKQRGLAWRLPGAIWGCMMANPSYPIGGRKVKTTEVKTETQYPLPYLTTF